MHVRSLSAFTLAVFMLLSGIPKEADGRTVPSRPRLAVMGFEAPDLGEEALAALEDAVAQAASSVTTMDVVGASDLRAMLNLGEMQQLLGCQKSECMTHFGDTLAVAQMISGSVRKVEKRYAINLQLLDLVNGRVLKRVSHEVEATSEALFSAVRRSVPVLFGVVGQLRIWNQPQGAELFLNGALVGTTPVDLVTVRTPGAHKVAILGPGVTPWEHEVQVDVGTDLRLRAHNQTFTDLRVQADSRKNLSYLLAGISVASAVGAALLWTFAVRNDRRLDAIDMRTAAQSDIDAITDRTTTFVISSGALAAIAAVLGGTALYTGVKNPAADLLKAHGGQ